MPEDVKQLVLQIDASVELMRRNLQQSVGSLNQFETAANRSADTVSGAFGRINKAAALAKTALLGFVTGVGVQGVVQLGRSILQLGDDIEAAANQANVSVERYQTLKEGLRALELTTEQTDQVLNRLSETLGAVQGGTAAAGVIDALDRMGITSRILNGEISTTDGLLDAIAASASGFATEAEFTASVVDILGRKVGVDLAAALRDGGVALKDSEQAFRDAGGVIDAEYIKKLADANEAIDSFVSRSKAGLAIFTVDVATAFGTAIESINEFERKLNRGLLNGVDRLIGVTQPGAGAGAGGAAGARERDLAAIGALPAGSDARRKLEADFAARFGALPEAPAADIVVTAPRLPRLPAARSGVPRAPARSARPGASAADRLADSRADAFAGVASRLTAEAGEPLSAITADLGAIEQAAQRAGEALGRGFTAGEALSRDISRNLAQGIVYGQGIGTALVNSFKAAAAEALANGLFTLFRSLAGGSNFGNALQAAISAGVQPRALGGPVSAGKPYLVGEMGRELFIPSAAGMIVPNSRLSGGGAGGPMRIEVETVPNPLFATVVRVAGQQGGAQAAQGVVRQATRGRLMGSRGA